MRRAWRLRSSALSHSMRRFRVKLIGPWYGSMELVSKKPTSNGVMKAVNTSARSVATSQRRKKRECGCMTLRDIFRMRMRLRRTSSRNTPTSCILKEPANKLLMVAELLRTRLFRLSSAAKVADWRLTKDSLLCALPKSDVLNIRAGLVEPGLSEMLRQRAGCSPCGLVGLLRGRQRMMASGGLAALQPSP